MFHFTTIQAQFNYLMLRVLLVKLLLLGLFVSTSLAQTTVVASSKNIETEAVQELEYFVKEGKYGFRRKDTKEIVVAPKYDGVAHFVEGLAKISIKSKYGFINSRGEEVVPAKYDEVGHFSNGLAKVALKGKFGFVNKEGKEIVEPKYADADDYKEGIVWVKLNGKYGWLDTQGIETIPVIYDAISYHGFIKGMVRVKLAGKEFYINQAGECVKYCPDDAFLDKYKIKRAAK